MFRILTTGMVGAAFVALGTGVAEAQDAGPLGPSQPAQCVQLPSGTLAEGLNNLACGETSVASGLAATAVGGRATASGSQSVAVGTRAAAAGDLSAAMGDRATASGDQSNAIGGQSAAVGDFANAFGNLAQAGGEGAVAIGNAANSAGAVNVAIGNNAAAGSLFGGAFSNGASVAVGGSAQAGATATNQARATALGFNAQANILQGTAIGAMSSVIGVNAVALGQGSVADLDNTVSIGAAGRERRLVNLAGGAIAAGSTDAVNGDQLFTTNQNVAAARNAADAAQGTANTALTTANTALTTANTAIVAASAAQVTADTALERGAYFRTNSAGDGPQATGADSIAIGPGSVASGSRSVAVGPDAAATRDNQMVLGSTSTTYTAAGVSSAASRAAQSGAVALITTDASGNLATSSIDVNMLAGLDGRAASLENRAASLEGRAAVLESQTRALGLQARKAEGGIAAAMAMSGTMIPPDAKMAVSLNLSTFGGEQGYSAAMVARLSQRVWASGGYAGSSVRGSSGGRFGVTFGW